MARKKFDTNPLDPEFPEKVRREAETNALPQNNYATAEFPTVSEEDQTRRFSGGNQDFNAYQSPFDGQNVPAAAATNYQQQPRQTANIHAQTEDISRRVDKIGMPENILTALCYVPAWIGLVVGLVVLLVAPKSEAKVRFHAAQGLAAHIAIFIISFILKNIGGVADVGNWIFLLVTSIMLIIFAIKAWRGKPVHIEPVDDLTEWLEEFIKPRK